MSQSSYSQMWKEAMLELSHLLAEELPPEPPPPQRDRLVFFQQLATLYVRYIQVFRQLEEAHNGLVHPQKRRLIRVILNGVMGRILELKNDMVETEFSEYHYVNDVLHALKLTPAELEIPIPHFFLNERSKEVEERKTMVMEILKKVEDTENPVSLHTSLDRLMTEKEAIQIFQMVERARQGRKRAKLSKQTKRAKTTVALSPEVAAIRIQKVWRSYIERKKRDEMKFSFGIVAYTEYDTPSSAEIAAQAIKSSIQIQQKKHEEDYLKSVEQILKQLREIESQDMSNTMKNQIRQWFYECRDATGVFPDYPSEEDGGSALIFSEKTPQQLMEEIKESEDEEKRSKMKKKEEVRVNDEDAGLKKMPSAFLSDLEAANKRFEAVWKNRDESENFTQMHEVELIKEEIRKVIKAEVRIKVDEEMRQELSELKLVVDKDKGAKARAYAKKKKVSKGGKKRKKEKDLTADRTSESLCQELVEQGLIKQAKNVRMQDFLGESNYLGTVLRQNDVEPMPSLLDVREVLTLYAILPLGSQEVHEKAPLVKSILLVGPTGVGKHMLVHAVCRETGATLFDLSPYNTAGKYPGKNGLTIMLHMVFKVARLLQPSVIWIGETEKIFYRKVPREEEELDPRRLKKVLPKCLKLIKGEDRVLIIGTTRDPQSADIKALSKMYSKIILIPRPDYGSRYVLWKKLIEKQGGKIKTVDLSNLTRLTDGYTPGHMVQVINSLVSEVHIQELEKRSFIADDFIPPLSKLEPVFQKEEEAIKSWYAKTPLGKRRYKAATGKEEQTPPKGKNSKRKDKHQKSLKKKQKS
ncbi:dynein regulatory complex protein 11 [Cyprinodon tularosa]|uniref:dynein regulatory complex protein 11 n=1 Tax=Cyprinodon tularosa TaxID=77115 RepID=UPI0018E23E5C|nr:dynein regulatory complex protein 11 [Cyprinodon tularosa]